MTSQLHKKGEAWSARFSEPMSELVKRYTSSVFFDKRLALVDIEGSLAHASMLVFTSRGPESLSRVLIEASALGVPIAAMDTGGTRDIIEPGITGLLSNSPDTLATDVRLLRQDEGLRRTLGESARRKVEQEFDAAAVVSRIEALYKEVVRR